MGTPAAGDGRLRASHGDREQVVDVLKAAFVQGRLTQDELEARVGQALAARTYADLAALTSDLPAEPDRAPAPAPAPTPAPARAQPRNEAAKRAVKVGATAIGAIVVCTAGAGLAVGQPVVAVALPVFIVLFTALATAFVAALIAVALKVESRHQNRSRGQLPPGPASRADEPASSGPPPSDPARRRPRRPPGLLAVGRAGVAGSPALPRGGRTDRRLATGHGRARPAGLVLAGKAGCVRRS
jgi:Domain of unknown function (DUF1707)